MNSEISTFVNLSPAAVVKIDKQAEPRISTGAKDENGVGSTTSVSSNNLQVSSVDSKQDNVKESKKAESNSSVDLVKKAVEEGNSFLQAVKRNLQFKVDEATDRLVVKVVDSDSGELVRQIPSDELLALVERMKEQEGQQESQGLMIQDRA